MALNKNQYNKLVEKKRFKSFLKRRGAIKGDYDPKVDPDSFSLDLFACRGLYFLFKGDELVYIGMSTVSVMDRINSHVKDNRKAFDSFKILECWDKSDKQIKSMERKYIKRFKPVLNVVYNTKTIVPKDTKVEYR